MSKAERLAKKNFQPKTKVDCIFSDRTKCNLYRTSKVEVIQPIIDRINLCHCYLVDDVEKKVIGIAVADSHHDYKILRVPTKDFFSYSNEEEKSIILANCRKMLGH